LAHLRKTHLVGEQEYVTPVGDTFGTTRVFVYNPNTFPLNLTWTVLVGGINGTLTTFSKSVPAGSATATDVIPTGSGARIVTNGTSMAYSVTDTEGAGASTFTVVVLWSTPYPASY
jgi:hypothetical protein